LTGKPDRNRPEETSRDAREEEVQIISVDAVDEEGQPLDREPDDPEVIAEDRSPEVDTADGDTLDAMKERWLRARADLENYRRRTRRDRERMQSRAKESVISSLLPVLDDLDRALDSEAGDSGLRQGVEMIARSLREALAHLGLEPVAAEGTAFDPNVHEASETEVTDQVPPQTVVAELRRGYLLGGQLLRPAMVRVAIPPEEEGPP
jgi:molecular chaperone GrpE